MDSCARTVASFIVVLFVFHPELANSYVLHETPRNTPYTVTNAVFYYLSGNYSLVGPKQESGTFQVLEVDLSQNVWMILYKKSGADKIVGNPCGDNIRDIHQEQIVKIYNNHTLKTANDQPDTWTVANNTIMCFQILQRASTLKWGSFKYKFEDKCRKQIISESRSMSVLTKTVTIRKDKRCYPLKTGFYTVIDFQMTLKNATSLDRVAVTKETTYQVQECKYVRRRRGYYNNYETVKECNNVRKLHTDFLLMVTGQTPEKYLLPQWPLVLINITQICFEFDAVEAMEFKDDMVFRVSEFPACTGEVTNRSGIIVSPGYPRTPYNHSTDCTWTIKVRPGEKVLVQFGDTSSDCSNDFLMLSGVEGGSLNKELLCGATVTGKTFMSTSYQLSLRFKTSTFKNLKGFLMNYTVIGCNLQGLKFPSNSMIINRPKGFIPPGVFLRIGCKPGFVFPSKVAEVKLGCSADNTWLGNLPFCIGYSVCNTTVSSPAGYVTSPGYPQTYPKDVSCEWKINAKKDQRILLKVEDIRSNCMNDFIVLDGVERTVMKAATTTTTSPTTSTLPTTTTEQAQTTDEGSNRREKRSGTKSPSKEYICGDSATAGTAFTSVSNTMKLSFRTNVFQENGYFNISYQALGCSSDDLRKPRNCLLRNLDTYYPVNYKLVVGCVTGFSFPGGIGRLTVTCGRNGVWVGRIPFCIRWRPGL